MKNSWFLRMKKNYLINIILSSRLQNFPQSHQLITTLNGSVPTTQTLTTTAAFNNINSSSASSSNYVVSEDEISKKLPKEILLRILSYLDVVSLCRCAQVSIIKPERKRKKQQQGFENSGFDYGFLLSSWDLKRFAVVVSS